MSIDSARVAWTEGLFLRPQHFQQQDRFFARQVDLEAFGSAALTWQRQWFRAVGGAATFRFSVMDVFPVSVTYQYAWRFDGRADGLHQVFLSLE
jgi:hypothetical protein